jgi:hypothetical protein
VPKFADMTPDTTIWLKTDVEDYLKEQNGGPYRKGPDGLWYLVTPFSDPQPWLQREPSDPVDPEFVDVFGERPQTKDYVVNGQVNHSAFQLALNEWETNKERFQGIVNPVQVGYEPTEVNDSLFVLKNWGIEPPTFYNHKVWGFMGRFVDTEVADLDLPMYLIVKHPHHTVSTYQIANFERNGVVPTKWHPFVPGHITIS